MFMKSQIQMIWTSSFIVRPGEFLGSLSFFICNLSIHCLSASLSFSCIGYFSSHQFVFPSIQRSMAIFMLCIHRPANVLVLFSSQCCWDWCMEFNEVEKCGIRYISMITFQNHSNNSKIHIWIRFKGWEQWLKMLI